MEESDCMLAARELSGIVSRRGIVATTLEARGDFTDRGWATYTVRIGNGDASLLVEWSCGSAVALHAGGKDSRYGTAAQREAIRRKFAPPAVEVLASLLTDDASIEGQPDWLEWAAENGMETPQAMRDAYKAWRAIEDRATGLRAMLGDDFTRARELAVRI